MNRRLGLLLNSFTHMNFGGSLPIWFLHVFGPKAPFLAKRKIEKIQEEGEFYAITFKNIQDIFYTPKSIPLNEDLYPTLVEQFYKWQWHYFPAKETPLTKEDVVLDCGCAEGIFPFLYKNSVKHTHAFEPMPIYFPSLEKMFSNIPNVTIIKKALGSTTKNAYIINQGRSSFITEQITNHPVSIITADQYCDENNIKPTFIKADIEGYELEFLEGAKNIIKNSKPKMALTTYHVKNHAKDIEKFIKSCNPSYSFRVKGVEERNGDPVMIHAW